MRSHAPVWLREPFLKSCDKENDKYLNCLWLMCSYFNQVDLWRPQSSEGIHPGIEVDARIPASAVASVRGELKKRSVQYRSVQLPYHILMQPDRTLSIVLLYNVVKMGAGSLALLNLLRECRRCCTFLINEVMLWIQDRTISSSPAKQFSIQLHSHHTCTAALTCPLLIQRVLTENIQDLLDHQIPSDNELLHSPRVHSYTKYHTMAEIYAWMDQMKETHKDLVTKHHLGVTYQNRTMYFLKISRKSDKPKKIIWMDCGIHAREWIAPAFCQWFVKEVLETYTANPKMDRFLQNIDFYVLPVLNIDGYIYSWTKDRLWRKSMSPCTNTTCFGTDLNRNFDAKWCSIGASRDCCSNIYCGAAPESEPESQAVASFLRRHEPDILCYLTIHSYGQLILTPYGYTNSTIGNHDEMVQVGEKAATALEQEHGTKFKVGPSSWILYYSSGSSRDWAGDLGINFSYTFELRDNGTYQFLLPDEQIQPCCEETMAAVTTIIEYINEKHFQNSAAGTAALWLGVLSSGLLNAYIPNSI
ncbi:carboxypeptidase O [Narcine bancroftii]|uniref:carboxypeptidase O n=1 Tax=Narcine bancroftii TaxID=1343680 RepID=UPI0038312FA1